MDITAKRYLTDKLNENEIEHYFDKDMHEIFSKPTSQFEEVFGSNWREAVDRGRTAAKKNNLKYFCTYLHFKSQVNHEHTVFYDIKDFLKEYIDFDIHSMNFSPILKETETRYDSVTVSYHAFILEASYTHCRERKAIRYCLPRVNEKRLEVLERYCEIHLQERVRSGYYNDYVISQFKQRHLLSEAEIIELL